MIASRISSCDEPGAKTGIDNDNFIMQRIIGNSDGIILGSQRFISTCHSFLRGVTTKKNTENKGQYDKTIFHYENMNDKVTKINN